MDDCIFCKLASHEIPTDIVCEDDEVIVFRDAAPQAPVHVLMIPKKHIASLDDTVDEDAQLLGRMMLKIKEVAASLGLENGYRVVSILADGAGITLQAMLSAKALPGAGHTSLAAFKSDVDLGDHLFVHGRVISSRRGELSVMAEPLLREGAKAADLPGLDDDDVVIPA